MPGRSFQSAAGYRYGFGGQEKDDEIAGSGNSYTAENWQYDSRLGRRWNVDPVVKPHESPYATFANNPIWFVDPSGADTIDVISGQYDACGELIGDRTVYDPLILFTANDHNIGGARRQMTSRDFYSQYQTYSDHVGLEFNGQNATRQYAQIIDINKDHESFNLAVSTLNMDAFNKVRQLAIEKIESSSTSYDLQKLFDWGQGAKFDIKRNSLYLVYIEGAGIYESDFIGNVMYGSVWGHFQSIDRTLHDGNFLQNGWSYKGTQILFGVDDPFDALALSVGHFYGHSSISTTTFKLTNSIDLLIFGRNESNAVYLDYEFYFYKTKTKLDVKDKLYW